MLGEGIKIPVVVQQVVPAFDATGSDHSIDGFANGHAEVAQCAEVFRRLNRDFLSAQFYDDQRSQHFSGSFEVSIVDETLQDFREDQVSDSSGIMAKQSVKDFGLSSDRSLEVVDPYAGIDQNQRSLLIALRSPCHLSLPRSRRI